MDFVENGMWMTILMDARPAGITRIPHLQANLRKVQNRPTAIHMAIGSNVGASLHRRPGLPKQTTL